MEDIKKEELVEETNETPMVEEEKTTEEKVEEVSEPANEETTNEETTQEESVEETASELEMLRKENEMLKQQLLEIKYEGLSEDEIGMINNSNYDASGKEYLLNVIKQMKDNFSKKVDNKELESEIVSDESYEEQFDENGDIIVKDLQDLL